MPTTNTEVLKLKNESPEPISLKKDIQWKIEDCAYVVRNVPYIRADYDGEELLDLDVSIKVSTLHDLMVKNAIPQDVNYDDYADIKY